MKRAPGQLPILGIAAAALFQSLEPCAAETNAAAKEWSATREAWAKDAHAFTPAVESAYLAAAKVSALQALAATNRALPADFLAWIDADPVVRTTVYGARRDPSGVLLMLRSLELDLGAEIVRKKYTQLALAMAVAAAKEGPRADLSPRPPLVLQIGGDPRKLVNTKDQNRTLDVNDHIVNFLNEHTVEEEVVVGQKEEVPELKYDDKGVAIPAPARKGKPKLVPVTEKRTRTLHAADVIASPELQQKFNAYMEEKGQDVRIDCGDRVVHWKSGNMVRGEPYQRVLAAFKLFKAAYEAKGLLPAARDPLATPAERCAYLIRNHEHQFPADVREQRKWPRFPLSAPWPVLTMLVANDQPLREREERWVAFRDRGEFRTYGEYIGSVAQQFDMQSARRLKEYPFTYGSIQMMLKDGGVCGTMANISARSHCTLGVPASTAGQPGHCALVLFGFDPKTGTYNCHGAQYATAGDSGTGVHAAWLFGDVDARRPMVYHQSIAWSVNHGLQAYLDSTVAHTFYRQLPEADRRDHGAQLLASASSLSPFNFLLVDDALEGAGQPDELISFWANLQAALAAGKTGCPTNGLYHETIRTKLFARLAVLPVPAAPNRAEDILAFLQREGCNNQEALAAYKLATFGLPALLAEAAASFTNHLATTRSEAACETMASRLGAAAGRIGDRKQRAQWAGERWQELEGRELYLGRKNAITADKSAAVLVRLAGRKPRPEKEQVQSLLDRMAAQLQAGLATARTPQGCKQLAAAIGNVANQLKDAGQKRQWLELLARAIAGKESYQLPDARKNAKPLRDPCADVIAQGLNPPQKPSAI